MIAARESGYIARISAAACPDGVRVRASLPGVPRAAVRLTRAEAIELATEIVAAVDDYDARSADATP